MHTDGKRRAGGQPGGDAGRPREAEADQGDSSRRWVFADPDRTERLVRLYNDTYNNLRLAPFDGSHLDFPGMNRNITLHAAPEGRRVARA